jgi:hypothetical protein
MIGNELFKFQGIYSVIALFPFSQAEARVPGEFVLSTMACDTGEKFSTPHA